MREPGVLWAVRRLTLGRGLKRKWASWRASGGPVVLAYAVPVFGVLLVGGLEELRQSHLALPAWTLPVLALALNAWALWQPRHPLALHTTDLAVLKLPIPSEQVLLWPLLRALGTPLAAGLACALLVFLTTPLGWLAVAPLLSALGSVPLAALARDARWRGDMKRQWVAAGLAALPLVGLLHPVLLLPATLTAGLLGARWWFLGWQERPGAGAVRDMEFSGLVQTAAALQIPPPTTQPGARLQRPRWRPGLKNVPTSTDGAFRAVIWRSLLHLLRQPWRLAFPVLLGAALPPLLPATLSLGSLGPDPLSTGALLLLSGLLALCLGLGGPGVPAFLPLGTSAGRLARTLPAALVLGGLAGCAALTSAQLCGASAAPLPGTLLLPWAALSLGAWGDAGHWLPKHWLPRGQAAQMKLGLAFLPVLALFLTVHSPLPWLAPLALLLLGLLGHLDWLYQTVTARRTAQQKGPAPARPP